MGIDKNQPFDKKTFMSLPVDPEQEVRRRRARRTDLATVYGVALSVPLHAQDENGHWRYGVFPDGGLPDPELVARFQADVRAIAAQSAQRLVDAGVLTEQEADAIEPHEYRTGPHADGWPQLFVEIYQQAEPFVGNAADLISVADTLRQIIDGVWDWFRQKSEEAEAQRVEAGDRAEPLDLNPYTVLTLLGVVALCYTDLVRRHGRGGEIGTVVFPRNAWLGYGSPDQPSGAESYLIRFTTAGSDYFYIVDGRGKVCEHYRTEGDDLVLLQIPELVPTGDAGNIYRDPVQPRRFEVRPSALPDRRER